MPRYISTVTLYVEVLKVITTKYNPSSSLIYVMQGQCCIFLLLYQKSFQTSQ